MHSRVVKEGNLLRKLRQAGAGTCVLAILYLGHVAYVFRIGAINEQAARSIWVYGVVAAVVTILLISSGIMVATGKALWPAVLLSVIMLTSGSAGAILGLRSKNIFPHHLPFIVLDACLALGAVVNFFLLERVRVARAMLGKPEDVAKCVPRQG